MHKVKTRLSLDIIENTLRNDSLYDVKASHLIISIAVKQIEHYNKDKYVNETIQNIFRNWKIYSGQINFEGKKSQQIQELENIFNECSNIRIYLNKLL